MPKSPVISFVLRELKEMIPPTLFFAIAFNLIVLTTQLILDDYRLRFLNFMIATTAALVVGKSVLVANAMPFLRRFDDAPLIQPVLFKTTIYFLVVFVVRVLEKLIEYLIGGGTLSGVPEHVREDFSWHRFAAIQIWIFVLFLIYTATSELNALLGDGGLVRIFFARRSAEAKPTCRHKPGSA